MRAIVVNMETTCSRLPVLSETERRLVEMEWNASAVDYPRESTVVELFEAQVHRNAEKAAVSCSGEHWTMHSSTRMPII